MADFRNSFVFMLIVAGFSICSGGCSRTTMDLSTPSSANYVVVDPGTASMMKAPGICYFAHFFPDYRDIAGVVFVGKAIRILGEEETAIFREKNCFDGFTGCWYYPVVEMSVERVLKGEAEVGALVRLVIAPLRTNEVSARYLGGRSLVFARRFRAESSEDFFTNLQATYFLQDGYALGTSEDSMIHDFGGSQVTEDEFLEYVRKELIAHPEDCAWDEFAGLRSFADIQESGNE